PSLIDIYASCLHEPATPPIHPLSLHDALPIYRGAPLVKKGGTLVITHPCTDKFDHAQHAPYVDFVHRLLPETRDAVDLHRRYEADRKSTRLNSSHEWISYAVFCLKKKTTSRTF